MNNRELTGNLGHFCADSAVLPRRYHYYFPLLPEHSPSRKRRTEASSCIVGVWVSEAEKVGGAPSLSSFVFLDTTPARRAVAEFIYHYYEERNHQGLGNAFVFLDTTA